MHTDTNIKKVRLNKILSGMTRAEAVKILFQNWKLNGRTSAKQNKERASRQQKSGRRFGGVTAFESETDSTRSCAAPSVRHRLEYSAQKARASRVRGENEQSLSRTRKQDEIIKLTSRVRINAGFLEAAVRVLLARPCARQHFVSCLIRETKYTCCKLYVIVNSFVAATCEVSWPVV